MSATCERCGHVWSIPTDQLIKGYFQCPRCNPPAKSLHERLDEARVWLDYGDSYWRYPAWWAIFVLAAFCIVNAGIVFTLVIKWLWGF